MGNVRRIMKLVVKRVRDEAGSPEKAHMGEAQYHVLHALTDEGQLTAGDLAERCHVGYPAMSKTLGSLETSGLIERRTDPTNRRVVLVTLTPAGQATSTRMIAHFESRLAQVLGRLDNRQLEDLIVAFGHLETLIEDLDQEQETAHSAKGVE
jgi:DNA-binding MarR family transcriptional regulator